MARLVIAAKYALAHKGVLLEREKLHLSSMGFSAEELVEVTFAVGQMAGLNLLYVAPRPSFAASRRRFTHTGTSTSSAKASRSRRSSRARARSRTRSTRTSSRRPSFDHFPLFCATSPKFLTTIIRSSPAGYSGSRSASSAATASPWTT